MLPVCGTFFKTKTVFSVETESYIAMCLHLLGLYPHFGCISGRALVMAMSCHKQVVSVGVIQSNNYSYFFCLLFDWA